MSDPQAGQKPPLTEVLLRLDHIVRSHPAARLLVDMARDATTEAARQQAALLEAGRRLARQRDRARRHAAELLDALSASPVGPRPAELVTPETALIPYRQLRNELFPAAARRLHEVAGRGEARDYQVILVERLLRKGQRMVAETALRRPDDDQSALRGAIRDHLGRKLLRHLARRAGCRVNPDAGAALSDLLRRCLALLDVLLSTDPAVRLFWPQPGEPLDPAAHERGGGKPGGGHRVVRAVLFPGLRSFSPAPTVLERAVVATAHAPE